MMKLARCPLWVLALLLLVPILLLANGGDATTGKTLYGKKCATCHGKEGEGKAAIAKMLKVELKHLGSKEVQAKSDADLSKNVTEGSGKMKPVKGLSDADVNNVVAFVRTLKQ
jgi:cytochrome c553